MRKKREKTEIANVRNERAAVITDSTDMKRIGILWNFYKFNNLYEMVIVLEIYKLPKLIQNR